MAESNPAGAAAPTPKPWKPVEVLRFKFDNFDSLPSELDKNTCSETVACSRGHTWALTIYPGGKTPRPGDVASEEKMICLYLHKMNNLDAVDASPTFIIRNASGVFMEFGCPQHHFVNGDGWGKVNFFKRSAVEGNQNVLVDGALLVDVELWVDPGHFFVPPNPHAKNMLALLENRERADIAFKVEGTKVYAHKIILESNAPVLFSLCSGCSKRSPVPINGVIRPVFEIILRYIYAGSVPGVDEVLKWSGSIIDAANRYAVVGLKMAVESAVIRSTLLGSRPILGSSNVVTWLLFADAKTCPLIKEYAIAMIAARPKDFLSDARLKASPALMHELLVAISDDDDRFGGTAQPKSVSELRQELHEKGLDVDGSKDMLVARLEGSNKRQRTE